MTKLEEWQKDPKRAEALAILLKKPILIEALEIVASMTMASAFTNSSLLQITNHDVCFGVDVGRASTLKDLQDLAVIVKEQKQLKPDYKGN